MCEKGERRKEMREREGIKEVEERERGQGNVGKNEEQRVIGEEEGRGGRRGK